MLNKEKLEEILRYFPDTGELWVKTARGTALVGRRARKRRYLFVKIEEKSYLAHRLIWLLVYGEFPNSDIDHINGNKADNRLCNLRAATRTQNHANRKAIRAGLKGAYPARKRWVSKIQVNGVSYHLGTFSSEEEAHAAYVVAATHYFGEFARAA